MAAVTRAGTCDLLPGTACGRTIVTPRLLPAKSRMSHVTKLLLSLFVVALVAAPVAAGALWDAASTDGDARARSHTMPTGDAVHASFVGGSSIAVSWGPSRFPSGAEVSGYVVTAYAAGSDTPRMPGGSCAGVVTTRACTDVVTTPGTWEYTVTPAQGAHWRGAPSARSERVGTDTTAPVTTDDSAKVGSAWWRDGKPVTITLSATDGGSGVAATYFTTDGSAPTTASARGTSIALQGDGVYTVRYFSVDNAGNAEPVKTAVAPIRLDATAPTVSVATPHQDELIGSSVTLTADTSDATSGVVSVQYLTCSGLFCTPSTVIGTSTNASTHFALPWNTSALRDTPYQIVARATDAAGNARTSQVRRVFHDIP